MGNKAHPEKSNLRISSADCAHRQTTAKLSHEESTAIGITVIDRERDCGEELCQVLFGKRFCDVKQVM